MLYVHNRINAGPCRDRGFTLIELLVTVAIFAIGMLGLAALQGQGLKFNANAYERSQAVLLASGMGDRIRANMDFNRTNAANYSGIASPAAVVQPPCPNAQCSCVGVACTPAQMAAADAFEWLTLVEQTLPQGTASVTCSSAPAACTTTDTYAISVTWMGPMRMRTGNVSLSVMP